MKYLPGISHNNKPLSCSIGNRAKVLLKGHLSIKGEETVILIKHVTIYKNMRKWMVEFPRKFEIHDIKIAQVNSILITEIYQFSVIYFNFVRCCGSVVMLTFLNEPPVLSPFIEKSMVV